jgi:hypothetical protein
MTGESVPFFAMVIRGSMGYANEPLNSAAGIKAGMMSTLRNAASPYVIWMTSDDRVTALTRLRNEFYSLNVENSYEDVINAWRAINDALADTENNELVACDVLQQDVIRLQFANGSVLTVNTSTTPYLTDHSAIAAGGYVKEAGIDDN